MSILQPPKKWNEEPDPRWVWNNPKINSEIDAKLRRLRERAEQQPVSYIQLFREAMEIAAEQFHRAMTAEARLHKLGDNGPTATGN